MTASMHPPLRRSRLRFWIALGACLVGIAILCALGTWQVERLHWKQALIQQIAERTHAETSTGQYSTSPVLAKICSISASGSGSAWVRSAIC